MLMTIQQAKEVRPCYHFAMGVNNTMLLPSGYLHRRYGRCFSFQLVTHGNAKDTPRRVSKSTTPSLRAVPASLELSGKVYLG
jgi:hypothetical protein